MLRNATGAQVGTFPFADFKPDQLNEVRDWRDDPTFEELEGTVDRPTLLRWCYPGILYVDLRCAWVHEFLPGNENIIVNETDHLREREPYYRYIGNSRTFLLMMPVLFLVSTLENVIRSFQDDAAHRDILPFLR